MVASTDLPEKVCLIPSGDTSLALHSRQKCTEPVNAQRHSPRDLVTSVWQVRLPITGGITGASLAGAPSHHRRYHRRLTGRCAFPSPEVSQRRQLSHNQPGLRETARHLDHSLTRVKRLLPRNRVTRSKVSRRPKSLNAIASNITPQQVSYKQARQWLPLYGLANLTLYQLTNLTSLNP